MEVIENVPRERDSLHRDDEGCVRFGCCTGRLEFACGKQEFAGTICTASRVLLRVRPMRASSA